MKCPLCGYEFKENKSAAACKGCKLSRYCTMIKCPNCGYEMPAKPRVVKLLRMLRGEKNGNK